jgi:hypothetical protein
MPRASSYDTWPVRGKLQGKNGKKSKDVSGIDCATTQGFPRAGLVIDDNMQERQFVIVKDGEIVAGDMISANRQQLWRQSLTAKASPTPTGSFTW